jgi:tetratricopeptide (TPR) repeat protein
MINNIQIPNIIFPFGIEKALEEYLKNGNTISYISECGIDQPTPNGFLSCLIRLYASIKYLHENPKNGIAAINVAHAFDNIGERRKAIDVLKSIDKAGLPGLNRNTISEDPFFLIGYWLADYNQPTESLIYYNKCLDRQIKSNHGVIYSHIGTVYHDIKEFKFALEYYSKANNIFNEFENDHNNKQKLILNDLIDLAKNMKPLRLIRWDHGIRNSFIL